MVNIDWKRIMAITPEGMSEQEKDELYDIIAWYVPDFNLDRKHLMHFTRITQEVLKFKAEQVESLMNELDYIAAKQGEEEARRRQDLLDEIEDLKEQLEYHKRLGKDHGRSTIATSEELRSAMVKLEMQNEELLFELQEREKELMNEKAEIENYASQVATLEREKQELTRELSALQEETTERLNARSMRDSPEYGPEKQEELTEFIRQKNKHITQLLDDIETIEKENLSLRKKLSDVRDELSETTTNITEMTMQISKLKHLNDDSDKKITALEEQNKALTSQIEELVEEKTEHDKQLDEFAVTLNLKVTEWKNILDLKDNEIAKIKEDLKKAMSSSSMIMSSEIGELEAHQKVLHQEEQIKLLKGELLKATEEINGCTELIGKLKSKQNESKTLSSDQPQSQLSVLEEKIIYLEEKLKYAEDDAQRKAEEMSEMVVQIREYEAGEFGLTEAVSKIKKLEKNIGKKDSQIEKLIENCNVLEIEFENLEEQNMALREKLGISASDEIDTTNVRLKFKKDVEMIETLKVQLEKKEEDLVKYKLKNRKLVKFVKRNVDIDTSNSEESSARDSKVVEKYKQDNSDLEMKLLSVTKENEALRKGMHEILESIHGQDCSSTVEIQSSCLERLLEALDSRHVSGWYHPAMRLQAQLKSIEGKNEELRSQIRAFRAGEISKDNELQEAYAKIQTLESDLITLQQEEGRPATKTPVEEDKNGNLVTSYEEEQKMIELEMEFQRLKLMYDKKNAELEKLQMEFRAEVISQLKEIEGEDSDGAELKRQVSFLKHVESSYRRNIEELRDGMIQTEEKMLEQMMKLQRDKLLLVLKQEKSEKELWESVPKDKFEQVSKELTDLTMKYQQAVNWTLIRYDDSTVEQLQNEVGLLQSEKQSVLDELRIVKEKLIAAEGALTGDDVTRDSYSNEISILAGKLAASEVRELNEKQKSSHLEKVNLMIRSEQQEIEAHNKDLTDCIQKLTEMNAKLQETERDLQARLQSVKAYEDYPFLCQKLESLEMKHKELSVEKEHIQELFEISQGQCHSLQSWRDLNQLQTAKENELLQLLSISDDKTVVARLSHELLTSQLSTAQLTKTVSDLQNQISKLQAQNMCLETKIDESRRGLFEAKRKHLTQVEYLYEAINEVRKLYGSVNVFPNIEKLYELKTQLKRERNEACAKLNELKIKVHEYSGKRNEMEIQLECLEDLKAALKGDCSSLISWHNKSTELRLKETRSRRQNEFLVSEMSQLENRVRKLNEEIMNIEEKGFEREKDWENKQRLWEETQYELCQLLQDKGVKSKTVHAVRDESTATDNRDETRMHELESEVRKLKKEIEDKEAAMLLKEKLTSKPKTLELEETVSRDKSEEAEKAALKVTVQSLQNIIKQKEETIFRYQDLLKEGRDEHSKASGKLQEELRSAHEALTNQSKTYNRLKNSMQASQQGKDNTPMVLEKYITKMHDLEDELTECQSSLSGISNQLYKAQQEADRWRGVADDRLLLMEDMRQRLEIEYKNEIDNFKEEIQNYQGEVDHLKQLLEANHCGSGDGHNHKLMEIVQQLQLKLLHYEGTSSDKTPSWMFEKSGKYKNSQKEVESLKRQLKFSKDEAARLREQVRLLQNQKTRRPRTAGSSTTRSGSDSKSSIKEDSLLSKIKTLEELLQISKEREQELLESAQHRLKSAEEVARWDEKKRSQRTIDQLNARMKEKEVEIDVLKSKNESFRNMIHRCERDRCALESQLKSARSSGRIEKLVGEKEHLEAEVASLKCQLEAQQRHGGGLNAALLHEKLESQERKLAVLELSSQGQNYIVDELERLKATISSLEKANLKLESDNLSLELKLEKDKEDIIRLTERNRQLGKLATLHDLNDESTELRQIESDRAISSLNNTIEKLSADNKRLRNTQNKEPRTNVTEKTRREFLKLKEDHKKLRNQYLDVVNRNAALEEELKKCRYQIRLLEEKDLAESISKTNNLQIASDLSQELLQVKSQLAHKTHLLDRVKVLLTKAAAKEKALNEQVSVLKSMVPRSAI